MNPPVSKYQIAKALKDIGPYSIMRAYGDPHLLGMLADAIGSDLSPDITFIAGMGRSGIPLATAVALRYKRKLVLPHQIPNDILYGQIPGPDDNIVIVADVLNRDAVTTMYEQLSRTKGTVVYVQTVMGGFPRDFSLPVPFHSLIHPQDFNDEPV